MIGGTLDLGAGRRGVDMGPSAIRYAGLDQQLTEKLGVTVTDAGNVISPVVETAEIGDERARYLDQILDLCDRLSEPRRERRRPRRPAARARRRPLRRARLARRDGEGSRRAAAASSGSTRTATSTRPRPRRAATSTGWCSPPRSASPARGSRAKGGRSRRSTPAKLALVGVRSLDDGERELLQRIDAKVFTMSDVDRMGVESCMREALAHAAGGPFLHLSLDLDAVDPEYAPGVGTPVRGGLSYREAHLAMEVVAESGLIDSMDVVEVNPILDRENATGQLAVELVASALGARIL